MTRMAPPNKALEKHWQEQRERIKHGQVLGRDPLNPAPTREQALEAAAAQFADIRAVIDQGHVHVDQDETRMSLRARLARALARRGTE